MNKIDLKKKLNYFRCQIKLDNSELTNNEIEELAQNKLCQWMETNHELAGTLELEYSVFTHEELNTIHTEFYRIGNIRKCLEIGMYISRN